MAHALFSAFVTGSDLLCSRLIHDVVYCYSNGPAAQTKAVAHQGLIKHERWTREGAVRGVRVPSSWLSYNICRRAPYSS